MASDAFLAAVKAMSDHKMPLAEMIGYAERLKSEATPEEAIQLYGLWISMNDQDALLVPAYFNYAVLLADAGQLEKAREALEKAIEKNPDFYPAYINLGSVLERLGRAGEAINSWTALANRLGAITGQSLGYKLSAMKQVGRVLEGNRMLANAEHVLKQSLDIDPDQQDVLQHYVALRMAQCEWPVVAPWEGVTRQKLMQGTGPLSMAVYTDDPLLQLASGWKYCKRFIGYAETDFHAEVKAAKQGHNPKRLKIGYISSDLRNHAVGFIMAEMFELHRREQVEVFAYYCGIAPEDALKARIRGAVEHWVDISPMTDVQAAQKIREDGIDILVDVNGYTKDARTKIFAMRPAPVIVNWLGFPGSMGSPYHHYIIADDWIIPQGHEHYFSERVKRLPCYQPNDRKRVIASSCPTRTEAGLPEDATVFCSFNGSQKISRFTFDRWMTILNRVPGSVLWLLDGAEGVAARLRTEAEKRGVDPSRLVFAGKANNPDHLARYVLADLFLDNLPYGAHVTASDALWMGVPILTLSGRGFAARVCGSLVRSAGLPELVCTTPEEYIERAVELGSDRAKITKLKKKLADQKASCTLFDMSKLTQHLEALYREMWEEFQSGDLPVPDMANLDLYLEAGSEWDHDARETMLVEDYEGMYRERFARWHAYAPLRSDARIWTPEAIAQAEGRAPASRKKTKKAA